MRICEKIHYLQSITWFIDFNFLLKSKKKSKIHRSTKIFLGQNKKLRTLWYCMINYIAKFQGFWWTLGPFMLKRRENDSVVTLNFSLQSMMLFDWLPLCRLWKSNALYIEFLAIENSLLFDGLYIIVGLKCILSD
jgi:hypothetical protein